MLIVHIYHIYHTFLVQVPNNSAVLDVTMTPTPDAVTVTPNNTVQQSGGQGESQEKVRDTLSKMRRSITEPLMQYFHDLTLSSNAEEEPDVLNTPKSLLTVPEDPTKRLSRRLFPSQPGPGPGSGPNKEELKRHTASHSQIHEYQNISPTPSTDL